jgi:hypothetical protein
MERGGAGNRPSPSVTGLKLDSIVGTEACSGFHLVFFLLVIVRSLSEFFRRNTYMSRALLEGNRPAFLIDPGGNRIEAVCHLKDSI